MIKAEFPLSVFRTLNDTGIYVVILENFFDIRISGLVNRNLKSWPDQRFSVDEIVQRESPGAASLFV